MSATDSVNLANLPRLQPELLTNMPMPVQVPNYDRAAVSAGIVHIGVGSFHRAHQAVHVDACLAQEARWGIIGVSMRRPAMRDALAPQGFLYTVASRDGSGDRCRVIGSLLDVLVAPEDIEAVVARLADPQISLVTLTVTEKGYCLDPASGRLNLAHPDIVADLADPQHPRSVPGLLVAALKRREARQQEPFALLSCDNLRANGRAVQAAVADFAAAAAPKLVPWLEDRLACPLTMVDRIVPKTTESDIAAISGACGFADAWPVVAEPFSQWVIENDKRVALPPFDSPSITLVRDVGRYEEMKLRILNGSHSALAYLGLLAGHATVAQAMADPAIVSYLARLASEELAPTLARPEGVDLAEYVRQVHARFANQGMHHALVQIASDGSQKLPQRLLPAARELAGRHSSVAAIALAVAAWIRCWQLTCATKPPFTLADPLAEELSAAASWHDEPAQAVRAMFALKKVFAEQDYALLGAAVTDSLATLMQQNGVRR